MNQSTNYRQTPRNPAKRPLQSVGWPQVQPPSTATDSSSSESDMTPLEQEQQIVQLLRSQWNTSHGDDVSRQEFYLQERLVALELGDELSAMLQSFSSMVEDTTEDLESSFSGLHGELTAAMLVRMVEVYYVGQGVLVSTCLSPHFSTLYKLVKPFGDFKQTDSKTPESLETFLQGVRHVFERHFSGLLFCRAFGYCLVQLEQHKQRLHEQSQMSSDSLLDAYCVALYSVKLLEGKVDEFLNMEFGDIVEEELGIYKSANVDLAADDLLWCFSDLLLQLGLCVRKQFGGEAVNQMLEKSFEGGVVQEELLIAQLAVEIRPESPVSFLSSYQATYDLSKLVSPEFKDNWLKAVYEFVVHGLTTSESWGDPYYQYTFSVISAYWMPTTTYAPTPYCYADIQQRMAEASRYKKSCKNEIPDHLFAIGEHHETLLRQLISRCRQHLVPNHTHLPPLVHPLNYSTADRVQESRPTQDHVCDNCGKVVVKKLTCSKCGKVNYCNRQCQLAHWKAGHKLQCKQISASSKPNGKQPYRVQ
eukprot:Nitzschia sp. Nitz4//scaffold204_size40132//5029//6624//NITZ4_007537-RA/size40132-processed-gene-0.21-mRNA-1//-1//CDS//3329541458//137//frame0